MPQNRHVLRDVALDAVGHGDDVFITENYPLMSSVAECAIGKGI